MEDRLVPAVNESFTVVTPNPTVGPATGISGVVTSSVPISSVSLSVNWGDGTGTVSIPSSNQTLTLGTADYFAASHSYGAAGSYTITVTSSVTFAGGSGGSGGSGGTGGASSSAVVNVVSGGSGSPYVFVAPLAQVLAEGATSTIISVNRNTSPGSPLTVSLGIGPDAAGDPLAAWGTDYSITANGGTGSSYSLTGTGGTVTFGAGQTEVDLVVTALTTHAGEGTRGFQVTVGAGSGYLAGGGSGLGGRAGRRRRTCGSRTARRSRSAPPRTRPRAGRR